MSTKVILDEGVGYELYQEVFDPDAVYIRLHNLPGSGPDADPPSFDLQSNTLGTDLRVRIPAEIWETLKNVETKDLSRFKRIEESSDENPD